MMYNLPVLLRWEKKVYIPCTMNVWKKYSIIYFCCKYTIGARENCSGYFLVRFQIIGCFLLQLHAILLNSVFFIKSSGHLYSLAFPSRDRESEGGPFSRLPKSSLPLPFLSSLLRLSLEATAARPRPLLHRLVAHFVGQHSGRQLAGVDKGKRENGQPPIFRFRFSPSSPCTKKRRSLTAVVTTLILRLKKRSLVSSLPEMQQ